MGVMSRSIKLLACPPLGLLVTPLIPLTTDSVLWLLSFLSMRGALLRLTRVVTLIERGRLCDVSDPVPGLGVDVDVTNLLG